MVIDLTKFLSRKFLISLLGTGLLAGLGQHFNEIKWVIIAYIVAEGLPDAMSRLISSVAALIHELRTRS